MESGPAGGVDLLEQGALDVQPLDNRFDDPVDFRQPLQPGVKPVSGDELPLSGVKNGSGFSVRAR